MISIYIYEDGVTRPVESVDRAWLEPGSKVTMWVNLIAPTAEEARTILSDTFRFHPLSIEDALSEIHHPKVELYDKYLYLILHGIDFQEEEHWFATRDVDFFLGPNYLVTVHDGTSRSIESIRDVCERHGRALSDGPVGLLHRIVDSMVDNYRPEIEGIERQLDELENAAVLGPGENIVRSILDLKKDISSLRRVVIPQRDAIGRLARREFGLISDEMAYRFRDVYDHLIRLSDEAILLQDRVTAILDAYLSTVSNRLNQIVKVLTVMSTIFLPLTVLTGMWGMNIELPHFPGGDAAQFWWVSAIIMAIVSAMLVFFNRKGWI